MKRLPALFLLLGGLLGSGFAVLTPPNQVPDEWGHFLRAWEVSGGKWIATRDSQAPASFVRLLERFSPALDRNPPSLRSIHQDEWLAYLRAPLEPERTGTLRNPGANLYSFLPYLPAGVAVGAGRLADLPVLVLFYLGRLTNLALYLFAVWLALRCVPGFPLCLFAVALMPMSLHQAASLSADAATLSLTFLFIALVLRLAYGPEASPLTWRRQAALGALVAGMSLCKFNVWLVLLIALIPAARFGSRQAHAFALAGYLTLACGAAAAWQYANSSNVEVFRQSLEGGGIFAGDNLRFVWQHPREFVSAAGRTLLDQRYFFRQSFIGNLGHLTIPLPLWVVNGYTLLLAAVALTQSAEVSPARNARLLLAFIVLASTLSLFVLVNSFAASRPLVFEDFLNGRGYVPGVQGRYFIPFAPLGLLLLANRRLRCSARAMGALAAVWIVIASLTAFVRIWETFYLSWSVPHMAR